MDLTFLQPETRIDKTINRRGRDILEFMDDEGLFVLNGRTPDDEPGQYFFIGSNGSSVIDYVWVDYDFLDIFGSFKVMRILTSSDHFPIQVSISNKTIDMHNLKIYNTSYKSLKWDNKLKVNCQDFP